MIADTKQAFRQSIVACLDYILSLQSLDGRWIDWDLPPGSSWTWTTAYIGYRLRYLPEDLKLKSAKARGISSRQLLQNQCEDGGWSYNEAVETDADSTALAVLFLASEGRPVSEAAYRRLETFQCADGGFSTFLSRDNHDAWGVSHPDVSPIVLLALLTRYSSRSPLISRGVDYVIKQQTSVGFWKSFWWQSSLYATEANLALLNAAGIHLEMVQMQKSLANKVPENAFETALLILTMLHIDSDATAYEMVDKLIGQQQADGSWKSAPILRVTRRDCFEPWKYDDSGPLFADTNRLFTSATVLAALSGLYARL